MFKIYMAYIIASAHRRLRRRSESPVMLADIFSILSPKEETSWSFQIPSVNIASHLVSFVVQTDATDDTDNGRR